MEFLVTALADIADEAEKRHLESVAEELTSLIVTISKFGEIKKEAYIKRITDKGKTKYEVKSPKNNSWSGGIFNTREEAKKRLAEVEMFKHMKDKD